jgi:hypothetical protein
MLFWIMFAVLMVSLVVGLASLFSLYDGIGGYGTTDDFDRLVRESW